jgi:type I restriction enzyme R subunit
MATGAGKTFTAVTLAYRLLKFGGFRRILFLVDRNNLAEQTIAEFQNYRTPGDGRRFTEIYNVDKLTSAGMLGSSDVVVSTIQRVYSVLRGNDVTEGDDPNLDDYVPDAPSPSPTPRTCRQRRSTSSSSTRPTAPSTASGAGCSSTSTPTSSA